MAYLAAQLAAYLDNISVACPAAAALHTFDADSTEVRIPGLNAEPVRSVGHSWNQDMAPTAAVELGVLPACNRLVIPGTPSGTDHFVRDFLFRKGHEIRVELNRLVCLPHSLTCRDKWVIVSRSLQLRLQHISPNVSWAATLTSNNMLQTSARL
jgi:hypothetical protein